MENRSRKIDAIFGLIILSVIAAFVWLSLTIGGGAPAGANRFTIEFDSALGLVKDNVVAVAGVDVGRVTRVGVKNGKADLEIAVRKDVPVYQDASAAVRAKTLLGEKYLELTPGKDVANALPSGSQIKNALPTVEIDDVIRDAAKLLTSLNVILPPLEQTIRQLDEALQGDAGSEVAGDLTATIKESGKLIQELSALVKEAGPDVKKLFQSTSARAPGLFDKLESATTRVERLAAAIDAEKLKKATDAVFPVMEDAPAMGEDMKAALKDLRTASSKLEKLMKKVDKNLSKLDKLDEAGLRRFLQIEGVRINLGASKDAANRLKVLEGQK